MISVFKYELEKGTGFPIIALKNGLLTQTKQLDDIILISLLNNQLYDNQCEELRGLYLAELIECYENKDYIIKTITTAFQEMTGSTNDDYQLVDIIKHLILKKLICVDLLYKHVEKYININPSRLELGIEELIEIENYQGLKHIIKCLGRNIARINILEENRYLPLYYELIDKTSNVEVIYTKLSKEKDSNINAYLSVFPIVNEPKRDTRSISFENIDYIISNINSVSHFKIKKAIEKNTKEEVSKLYNYLSECNSVNIKKKLLSCFNSTGYICDYNYLVYEFNKTRDKNYKFILADSLRLTKNDNLRNIGNNKKLDNIIRILLVLGSFTSDQSEWLYYSIFKLGEDDIHLLISHLLESEIKSYKIYSEMLLLLYNKTRCSNCRKDIVEAMIENMIIDSNLLQELAHDCNILIREKIKSLTTAST